MTTPRRSRPPKHGLTFTPGNHQYRLDGQPCPGVTGILGVLDKPAIPKWAAEAVAEYVAGNPDAIETLRTLGHRGMVAALKDIPWKKRDDAGARGTSFHDIAQLLLTTDEVDVPDELVPMAEAALTFLDEWKIDPILVEIPVGHRGDWWAGTADLVARYTDPRNGNTGTAILDWKSGKAIYPEAVWQLNAYAHAEFYGLEGVEHPLPVINAAFGVHIRADGFDVYEAKFGADVYQEFVTIRRTFEMVKVGRGDWRRPGSGHLGAAIQTTTA